MILRKKNRALSSALLCILVLSHAPVAGDTPADVKRELSRVLAQEKFRYHDDGLGSSEAGENFFETLLEKIGEKVKSFRDWLGRLLRATPVVAALLYLLIFAAVVLLLVYVIRRIDPGLGGDSARQDDAADAFSLDFAGELRRAGELLEAGSYRESLQAMLGALWLYYNFARVFAYRRSVTNREYLARLGGRDEYGLLRDIVRRGEAAVYAGKEISKDECREIYGKVEGIITR
jgi:hypothetical protein